MKQITRLHDFFHPVIMFHIAGWKKSMRVTAESAEDTEKTRKKSTKGYAK